MSEKIDEAKQDTAGDQLYALQRVEVAERLTPQKIPVLVGKDRVSRRSCNSIWMVTKEYPFMSLWRKFQSSAHTGLCQRRIHNEK